MVDLASTHAPAPYIVGVGRSGTTLLRLMLDAHPDLAIPPETTFVPLMIQACERAPDPREAFLETVTSHRRWADLHLDRDALARRLVASETFDIGDALRT